MKTLTQEHSHLQVLKPFGRKQFIHTDERSIYIEMYMLLQVRDTSAHHQLKNLAKTCTEIWEIQLCSISDCKATEATKSVYIQPIKLTLFLLFLLVSLIRLGNQTLCLWSFLKGIFLLWVSSHTSHTQMQGAQSYSTDEEEKGKNHCKITRGFLDHFSVFFQNVK